MLCTLAGNNANSLRFLYSPGINLIIANGILFTICCSKTLINCFITVFTRELLFVFLVCILILCRCVLSFCVINEYVCMYEKFDQKLKLVNTEVNTWVIHRRNSQVERNVPQLCE